MTKAIILILSLMPIFASLGKAEPVVISEFLANPVGTDRGKEWIELHNLSSKNINLKNWHIKDRSGKIEKIKKDTWILPKAFLVIKPLKNITINNSGEELTLYNQREEKIFDISYSGKAKEGESFVRNEKGEWHWTNKPTPAKESLSEEKNASNQAEKIFTGSYQANFNQTKPTAFKLLIIACCTSLILAIVSAIGLNKLYK